MKTIPRIALAAAIALIAQGCSNMQWGKPGADPAAVSRDMDACRAQALGATPPVATAGSADAFNDARSPAAMRPAAGSNERFIDQHEALNACMLRRGYELRPAS